MRHIAPAVLLALALVAPALPARADVLNPVIARAAEGLTASGHAEVKMKPDVAYVTVGVVNQARDQSEAVRTNATRAAAVLAALKSSGFTDADLQTQFFGVQPQYDYNVSPAVLTGYEVTNTLQVTVHDLTKVGQVIDKASAAGANQTNGVSFDLSDRTAAQQRALSLAVHSARDKAASMATAAGVPLGRLLSITEGTAAPVEPVFQPAMVRMAKEAPAATPIQSQQISVTADVTLVYAIGLMGGG